MKINPFDPGYYNEEDLKAIGLKKIGHNVRIAKNCTILGLENIEIGNNVRIDGYTSIIAVGKGYVRIGSFIHIGGYGLLSAGEGIELNDFCNLSQGVRLYTRSDDYSGNVLTNPMIPEEYSSVIIGSIKLNKHVILGSGSIVLPGVTISEGCAIGALTLVKSDLAPWGIYAGVPAKRIKNRSDKLLQFEQKLKDTIL